MVGITERAKQMLLARKLSANIKDPEVGLKLARSPSGWLVLVADRMKAGDQVVKHQDSTVLLVDAELSELILAGTVDCTQTGSGADLVLTAPGGRAPRQR